MKKTSHIYQIYYDDITQSHLDPGFLPLNNTTNARPDWREYWPIRNFLISNTLDDETCYGFFSAKFREKTGLKAQQVVDFMDQNDADVCVFSPYVEQSAFFLSVFDQGESNHPGLIKATQDLLATASIEVDLRTIVCDFNTSIYSNFFVAKPAFWRVWLALGEQLFSLSESSAGPAARALTSATPYHESTVGVVELKVFIMERLASLVLALGSFSSRAYDPFELTRTGIPASFLDHEMRMANALKMAFLATRNPKYIESFYTFRNSVLAGLAKQ